MMPNLRRGPVFAPLRDMQFFRSASFFSRSSANRLRVSQTTMGQTNPQTAAICTHLTPAVMAGVTHTWVACGLNARVTAAARRPGAAPSAPEPWQPERLAPTV